MEQLKQLFESEILNEESRSIISEAFKTAVEARKAELEVEYAQKIVENTQSMIERIPLLVEESLESELAQLSEEVAHARTLEIQYAEKLSEFKESYAASQQDKIAIQIAEAVATEIEELKEAIEEAKKHEFGMAIYESFRSAHEAMFGGKEISVADELKEAKQELEQYRRKEKLDEMLSCLSGKKRKVAETVLEGVALDRLEEKFESIRATLMAESEDGMADDEKKPKDESGKDTKKKEEDDEDDSSMNESVKKDRFGYRIDEGVRFDPVMMERLKKSVKTVTSR